VSVGGDSMTFDDFQVINTASTAMLTGSRLNASRIYCAGGVIFAGSLCVIQGVKGPITYLGWVDGSISDGVVLDAENILEVQGTWLP
jgi:hypothetical protein